MPLHWISELAALLADHLHGRRRCSCGPGAWEATPRRGAGGSVVHPGLPAAAVAGALWIALVASAEAQPPIRIGASVSQTGAYALLGQNQLRGSTRWTPTNLSGWYPAHRMATYAFRLYTDRLAAKTAAAVGTCNRIVYLKEGDGIVRAAGLAAALAPNSAWFSPAPCEVSAGAAGATLLRWEIGPPDAAAAPLHGEGVETSVTLEQRVELDAATGCLMRCDRVDFPLGGIAYTHTHAGPGIRCLLTGGIRVEVNGHAHDVQAGEAWFEAGPNPVLATASDTEATAFARVLILPRALKGKSSIRYVKPEDQDKPKPQKYQIFADEFIQL